MYVFAVTAAVGHSRGRGLLKFSTGSPSPSALHTRPPGQVQWVSEQWSPPTVAGSPSPMNSPGLLLKNNGSSSESNQLVSVSPPVPSHSTPTLSLHSKAVAGQRAFGTPASADLSPSSLAPRSVSKRPETHSVTVNGDIPLMTSASDPLPMPIHVSPVARSPSPSLYLAKPPRASPLHVSIHPVQQNSPTSAASARTPPMSPVQPTVPVTLVSWPSSVNTVKSPHVAGPLTPNSASTQSVLSPLAPLFVPRNCSAHNQLVSISISLSVCFILCCMLADMCALCIHKLSMYNGYVLNVNSSQRVQTLLTIPCTVLTPGESLNDFE